MRTRDHVMSTPRLFALVFLASFVGCDNDELGAVPPCSPGARAYASFTEQSGELCDTQSLVASLHPKRVDPRAGLGALHVPFRVQAEEARRYCFGDDNEEPHRLRVTDDTGKVVLELVAGEPCKTMTLPAGAYAIRLEHATAGAEDATPDVIHSQLSNAGGVVQQSFTVNSCPGCDLSGVEWPCARNGAGSVSCGYTGDYPAARFTDSVCPRSWYDDYSLDRGWADVSDCYLSGTFDGADLDRARLEPRSLLLGDFPYVNAGRRTSSFADTAWPTAGVRMEVSMRGLTKLTGRPGDVFSNDIYMSTGAPVVDLPFARALWNATTYSGESAAEVDVTGTTDWSKQTLDFARVRFANRPQSGLVSYDNYRFDGATLRHLRFADGDAIVTLSNASFRGATITDSTIDASDMNLSSFVGATITRTSFGPRDAPATKPLWDCRNCDFSRATLTDVSLSARPAGLVSTLGPILDGIHMNDAVILGLSAHHASFRGSDWTGATIGSSDESSPAAFSAYGADFSGASFVNLRTFTNVQWVGSKVGTAADIDGGRPFVISVASPAAKLVYWNLDYGSLDADLSTHTLRNPQLVGATVAGKFFQTRFEGGAFDNAKIQASQKGPTTFDRTTFTNTAFAESTISANFDSVTMTNGDFRRVYFVGAAINGFDASGTNFTGARFCSTPVASLHLHDVSFRNVHFPLQGQSATQSPLELPCVGTDAVRSVTFSGATTCPNGSPAPCVSPESWVPMNPNEAPPRCCDQLKNPQTCVRKIEDAPCANGCDCESLSCLLGKCAP